MIKMRRTKHRYISSSGDANLVPDAVRRGVRRRRNLLHDDKSVQKVRGDHIGRERRVILLEDHRHDVIADVPLALELLMVVLVVREQSGHVEHDLFLLVVLVDRVLPGLTVRCVQAAAEPCEVF